MDCVPPDGPKRQEQRQDTSFLLLFFKKEGFPFFTQPRESAMQLNPYLHFAGNCREAFGFYHKSLGGEIKMMSTYADTPMAAEMSPDWQDKIVHARLITDGAVLMGSDSPPERFAKPQGFTVSIDVADPAEADRIFAALSEGGEVSMPIGKTFWAERFGMFTDKFGVPWMVNCEVPGNA